LNIFIDEKIIYVNSILKETLL